MKLSNVFKGAAAIAAAFLCVCAANVQAEDGGAFSVDFSQKIGDVRPINGINLWANMSCETLEDRRPDAAACRFSTVRLHDAPWDNNGIRLVDVQQIFGNLDADPKDPKNYYFGPTDDYIRNILDAGAVPIYRLGTSIEHTATKYFAIKPSDPEH